MSPFLMPALAPLPEASCAAGVHEHELAQGMAARHDSAGGAHRHKQPAAVL